MPQYGEVEYWEQRYAQEPCTFDWYQGYHGLKPIIHRYLPCDAPVLQLGVGTSRLQEGMVLYGGYSHVVNVDYSKTVIAHMQKVHAGVKGLTYAVADCRDMPQYADNSFGGVLDKGTIDAVLCGSGSALNTMKILLETYRVLKPGCCYVMVTYGDPAARLFFLQHESLPWEVEIYVMSKTEKGGARESSAPGDEDEAAQDDEALLAAPRNPIKGPFYPEQEEVMELLNELESVHFIYVCRKPGGQECDDACDSGASSEDAAQHVSGGQPHSMPTA